MGISGKILVTGSNGQLGTELKPLLPEALFVDVDKLDITNEMAVNEFVKQYEIETIINCAAYTAVDKAEDEESKAYQINATGPTNLARTGCNLIHISTDYVFNGRGYKPYTPQDATDPVSAYGRTKLEGEKTVLKYSKKAVIIRTAWLYSSHGNNFVLTMRKLGASKSEINVINDQIGSPTFAGDLAEAIVQILSELKDKDCWKQKSGIYHFTNEGVCSWYDFAHEIMELSGYSCRVNPIPTSEYPTKAVRPHYSVLDKKTIRETFNVHTPYWRESLKKCLSQF
jgi:dTDP-4-dehydrorhamnose reductase